MLKKQLSVIYIISFFTAFCSLIYELQYSQLLAVLYGNSVLRYSITIGLYLFSLGLGSLSFRLFSKFKSEKVLWSSQLILSAIGPLGIIGIIWLDSKLFQSFQFNVNGIAIFIAHMPIVITGILAGIQIPLLSVLGNLIKKRTDMFVEVLGVDYFGSLVGAVLYGLYLYPSIGLIKTAFLVGLINVFLAILCLVFIEQKRKFIYISAAMVGIFFVLMINSSKIEKSVMDMYMMVSVYKELDVGRVILEDDLKKKGIPLSSYDHSVPKIEMVNYFNTPYQEVVQYLITRNGFKEDQCLKLSRHTNMCDSWANSYHDALVNVPMAFIEKRNEPRQVLLLGGGSLLPVKNLLKYNVKVDQVDIDKKFIDYARTDEYFVKYHQNAWQDPRVRIYFEDAYTFLRNNKKKYDLVVMTLPGFGSDKLMHLGSVEFFSFLSRALNDDGLMVTWEYGDIESGEDFLGADNFKHQKTLFTDIYRGGFKSYLKYYSYGDIMEDGTRYSGDIFYLFQKNNDERVADFDNNEYIKNMKKYYLEMNWKSIDSLNLSGIRASHIFSPNYDIMTQL